MSDLVDIVTSKFAIPDGPPPASAILRSARRRARRRRVLTGGVVAVASVGLLAYTTAGPLGGREVPIANESSSLPYSLTARQTSVFPNMAISGRLDAIGQCLVVGESLVVWPSGTAVQQQGDRLVVVASDGREMAVVGETLKAGGGLLELSDEWQGVLEPAHLSEAKECLDAAKLANLLIVQ